MSPAPRWQHQQIALNIASAIREHLRSHPVGKVTIAPSDVELGSTEVYEPDVYFVSNKRAGIFTEQGATGAPDLAIEVLSPSTARLDRVPKREGKIALQAIDASCAPCCICLQNQITVRRVRAHVPVLKLQLIDQFFAGIEAGIRNDPVASLEICWLPLVLRFVRGAQQRVAHA